MTDVVADRVKVIIEAEVEAARAKIKAYADQYDQSTAQVEKAATRGQKSIEGSAAAQARAVEKAAAATEKAAAREQRAIEDTARKLAAQRRNQALTIQYTANDVIASLSSGSNPLTVLAQQGGQVTQAFGGLSGTLKALAPIAFSATGALTAAGVALGAAVIAADRFDASNKDLLVSVSGLGARAGLTVDELKALARANADAGNVSTSSAEKMAQAYIDTGRIGAEVTGKLIAITDDYAQVTRQSGVKAADELAAAFSDRTGRAALELLDRFGALDTKTEDLIKTLIASGDVQGAQVVAVNALSGAVKGQADNVSILTKAWRGFKNVFGSAGTGFRDFFTPSTDVEDAFSGFGGGRLTSTQQTASDAKARADRIARQDRQRAGQSIIDDALKNNQRRNIQGQITQVEAALAEGTVDAKAAAKAIKKLRDDLADLDKPKHQRKATQKEQREAAARRDGRYAGSPVSDRGVQSIAVVSTDQYVGPDKVRDFKPGVDPSFKAAADAFERETATEAAAKLQSLQQEIYDSTYEGIRGGLEAGFERGLPGVLEYFGRALQRELLDDLARGLTDLIRGARPGGSNGTQGSIISAVGSAIFGRAAGGNVVGGRPYIVNEGREEVFVPPVSGQMVPLSRMGGGQTIIHQSFSLGQGNLITERVYADMRRVARAEAAQAGAKSYQQAIRDAPAAVALRQEGRG